MNGLKALYRLLELVPEQADDILIRAHELEVKIQAFRGEVATHEETATSWISNEFDHVPDQIDALITFFQNGLQTSSFFEKIKHQDLSPLFTLTQTTDESNQDLIALKIKELKTFLEPLAIKDADEVFSAIKEILHEIRHPSNDTPTEASLKQTYDHLNKDLLQKKVNVVVEKLTGIPLTSEANTIGGAPEKVMEAIDEAIPEVEGQFNSFEQEQVTISSSVILAKTLEPIFLKVISALPLQELGIDPHDPTFKTLWSRFLTEVHQIDSSSIPNTIKSALQTLAKVCEANLSADHALHDLSIMIQKLHLIVSYFIDNGLFVPLKVKWLSQDESIPDHHGLNQERQAIKAAQAQQNVQQPQTLTHTGVDATTPTPATSGQTTSAKTPATVAFGGLLGSDHQKQAATLLNGDVFAQPMAKINEWIKQLIDSVKDLPHEMKAAWNQKEINNLDDLIHWVMKKIKTLINELIEGLQNLILQVITALRDATNMLLGLTLNIKVPGNFMQQWAPGLSALNSVNLFCLVLAVPWDVLMKFKDLQVTDLESWIKN
ncbi:MAG: hypothetical protein R8G66_02070 [Cytophagales bacterium]|nr:hypothetical protein [Cytophagales bacterium]